MRYTYFYFALLSILFLFGSDSCRSNKDSISKDSVQDSQINNQQNSKFIKKIKDNEGLIIFVHGLFGDPDESWTNKSTGAYFPKLISNDSTFKGFDVFTFGFSSPNFSSALSIDELADNMRAIFDDKKLFKYNKIVFVSHSMGGLVTRYFLLRYSDKLKGKTKLIYSYATPSSGSDIANWAKIISKNVQLNQLQADKNDDFLQSLRTNWLTNPSLSSIPSYCAYENKPTNNILIVSNPSATINCLKVDPLNFNHIDIVKPSDTTSINYIVFRNAFRQEIIEKQNELENINDNSTKIKDKVISLSLKDFKLVNNGQIVYNAKSCFDNSLNPIDIKPGSTIEINLRLTMTIDNLFSSNPFLIYPIGLSTTWTHKQVHEIFDGIGVSEERKKNPVYSKPFTYNISLVAPSVSGKHYIIILAGPVNNATQLFYTSDNTIDHSETIWKTGLNKFENKFCSGHIFQNYINSKNIIEKHRWPIIAIPVIVK